jgi:aldose sugar dehydrogenase
MDPNNVRLKAHSTFEITSISVLVFLILIGIANIAGVINITFATSTPTVRDSNLEVQTVTTGLSLPTSMAFLGPNDILVLEKETGMVKRIKDGTVLPRPLLDVNVATENERGLLGIDVVKIRSLQKSSLYHVFLYYTKAQSSDGGTPIANQLVRYLLINHPALGPAQGIMVAPRLLLNLPVTPGPNHDGGKVTIGPDRNVYTVLGDLLNRQTQAQNFENGPSPDGTSGILRVTQRGNTVGNGILGSTVPLNIYFAYGIRNSFGIDFDPVTGRLWDTENGPAIDEINLVEPGFNSGWADIMGMAPEGFDPDNLVSFGGRGSYSDPDFVWTQSVAPTAIEFLTSSKLGIQHQNDMFVGDFNNGRIYRFDLNPERTDLVLSGVLADKIANTDSETQSVIFGEGFGGVTDLKVGLGDGHLYVLSIGNGALYKILPKAGLTAFNDEFNQEREQGEEDDDDNEPSRLLGGVLDIPTTDNDNDENSVNNKDRSVCYKLIMACTAWPKVKP